MNPPVIRLYHNITPHPLSPERHNLLSARLPEAIRERIERLAQWEDRVGALAGKILLARGMASLCPSRDVLALLRPGPFGKPCFAPPLDQWPFNISHSGQCAVCAIAPPGIRVGVDIERVRKVPFNDFSGVFSRREWDSIHRASQPEREFFRCWTMKESIIKADGRGLSLPLDQFEVEDGRAVIGKTAWRTTEVAIGDGIICNVAHDARSAQVIVSAVEL